MVELKVFVDLDGLLVDFVSAICKAHGVANPYYPGSPHLGNWDMEDVLGLTPEEFWAPANSFEFWDRLEFMPDGPEILATIEGSFGQENICILTSPCQAVQCSAAKHAWITRRLPQYKRRFFLGTAKHFFAAPHHLLIDDYDKNVDTFAEEGGMAILFPRPWNRNHSIEDPHKHLTTEIERLVTYRRDLERVGWV